MKGLSIFVFLLMGIGACAQEGSDPVFADSTDYNRYVSPGNTRNAKSYLSENMDDDKFDKKKWKDIVGSADFEEKPVEVKSRKKWNGFSFPAINPLILKVIFFVIVFVALAFILYYVSKNTSFAENIKKAKPTDGSKPVDNIEELDVEALLKQALVSGDLRLAIRIHYLLLLKRLNEVGLITWKKDKTNSDYLSELYGRSSSYDDIRGLTLAYETVWYGERSVSQDSFMRLAGNFDAVNQQITRGTSNA
jgi:hypothetical protein